MTAGAVELDRARAMLDEAGFEHVPQVLAELIEQGVMDKLARSAFLELVCRPERDFREERRVRTP